MKKLTCHCECIEAEINVPDKGFEKICNSIINHENFIFDEVE